MISERDSGKSLEGRIADDYLSFLVGEIHTVVAATVDDCGLPVTCAIDVMDFDNTGLYFLTARGKGFYRRLKKKAFISITGIKGNDTLSSIAVSLRGNVEELGEDALIRLIQKNKYMTKIYPTEESRKALSAFRIFQGSGEFFDLSSLPIRRKLFSFGGIHHPSEELFISGKCIGCGRCLESCPQG